MQNCLWPAFSDLPKEGPGTGLGNSPRLSNLGTAVVLSPDDYERARKALLAEDVMMRRGWYAMPYQDDLDRWLPCSHVKIEQTELYRFIGSPTFGEWDAFTVLIEADKWYVEHVESKKVPSG